MGGACGWRANRAASIAIWNRFATRKIKQSRYLGGGALPAAEFRRRFYLAQLGAEVTELVPSNFPTVPEIHGRDGGLFSGPPCRRTTWVRLDRRENRSH